MQIKFLVTFSVADPDGGNIEWKAVTDADDQTEVFAAAQVAFTSKKVTIPHYHCKSGIFLLDEAHQGLYTITPVLEADGRYFKLEEIGL